MGGTMRFSGPVMLVLLLTATIVAAPRPPAVAEILEDDAEGLLKKLTSHVGEAHAEATEVFSGKQSVKMIPMQWYDREIPGWKYRIVEKPKEGEYRYLRFAWMADGCDGIMLQLHDLKDWYIRYIAGQNTQGWEAKVVADKPPTEWVVVTRDLYADFGTRTIQGLALTVFGGKAGYFDHIYFGRTVEELDRIDATGAMTGKPKALAANELADAWTELAGNHPPRTYAAFWRLRASPTEAIPFLKGKLAISLTEGNAEQIRQWIKELDSPRYVTREAAMKKLGEHIEPAAVYLEESLRGKPSPELRERAEKLLAARPGDPGGLILNAVRVLEYTDTPDARKCLEELAKGPDGARPTTAAREALKRMATVDR